MKFGGSEILTFKIIASWLNIECVFMIIIIDPCNAAVE